MSQIFVKCVCSVLYAGEVRDSKLLALPVKKILQLENEKRNQNSQPRFFTRGGGLPYETDGDARRKFGI